MLPSPRSSLSSFRDYYENTSQNSAILHRNQGDISIGFRNFQVLKLLERMEKKIMEKQYWNKFVGFKKIGFKLNKSDRRMMAKSKLKTLMIKNNVLGSKLAVKCQIIKDWLQSIKDHRERQIKLILKFGLFFSKRQYSNISVCFQRMALAPIKEEKAKDKDKIRFIKKLSKALLSIVFRNMMHLKFKRFFQSIKYYDNLTENKNSNHIRFFKPKKERLIYQHKIDSRINKLSNVISILKLVQTKIFRNKSLFFHSLKTFYLQPKTIINEQTGDSLDIMTNVVRHMIYLTGKQHFKLSTLKEAKDLKLKGLKLKFLWMRIQSSKRKQITKCIMKWRQQLNQEQVALQKQISRLQQIKRQFIQDL